MTEDPPDEIAPRAVNEEFRAESAFPHIAKGAVGTIEYILDDQGTRWSLAWSIPRIGDNRIKAVLGGPNKDKFETKFDCGQQAEASFRYTLLEKGGGTGLTPPDGPDARIEASCQITVTNRTQMPLNLAKQGHERGDFMTQPPQSIPPGGSARIPTDGWNTCKNCCATTASRCPSTACSADQPTRPCWNSRPRRASTSMAP